MPMESTLLETVLDEVSKKDVRAKASSRQIEVRDRAPAEPAAHKPVFRTVLAPSVPWVTDTTPATKRRGSTRR